MFDDLRSAQLEPEPIDEEPRPSLVERLPVFSQLRPQQRFVLALLLFMNVAVLGCACLLAAGKMVP